MKKKYIVAFLATLFFILAISLAALVLAQPTANSFGVEDANGKSGTYVEVPVSITNVTNVTNGTIQSIRLRVDYNENVLNLTNISEGDLTSNWMNLQLGEDRHTMVIATAYTGDVISDGSTGSVVLLNFSVIGSPGDMSPMSMTLIELSNSEGVVGTAPARNGTFTVTPTPTPTPSNGGGVGGGGGSVRTTSTPTPKPTEKTPAILGEETPSPTLAPTIAQAPTPTQTPTPTPASVLRLPLVFLILIAIAVIAIVGIIIMVLRRRE